MKTQLFKIPIPVEVLWDFLKKNGEEHETCYLFNKCLYKKAEFHELIAPFLLILEPYYYESKKHYVTRKMDYGKFITVIRQLCNLHNVSYTTKLMYNNSTYEIEYYIHTTTLVPNALPNTDTNTPV
jgi:hypothetical protein